MITPGYSLTSTERVLPRLALDFTTASLDPRVTVTRALNTATRINSSGLIEPINANLPRFDFTLNTGGVCKGLLIEEARTNSAIYSADISNAIWATVYGSFTLTGGQTDPSGGTTATILTGAGGFAQLISGLIANTTYTYSFYAKSVSGTPSYRIVSGGGTNLVARTSYASQLNASTYTRVSVTYTTGAADTSVRVYPMDIGSTTSVVLAFHQNEPGAFATSYIPTTTTSLTRNADDMSMTGTNFSSWFTTSAGALGLKFISSAADTTGRFALLVPGVGASMRFRIGSDIRFQETNGTGVVFDMGISGISANTVYTVTGGWDTNNFAACANAGNVATDTSGTPDATLNSLYVSGEVARGAFNGWVQAIRSWPFRVTNAELRAFSK